MYYICQRNNKQNKNNMKTLTQKTNDFINENNLEFSPKLFKSIFETIKADKNNIIEENLRVENLNNQRINNNYNILANMCYSKNK
jgi:ribosomal protein S20